MLVFDKIKHFFLVDPADIGAQGLKSDEILARMRAVPAAEDPSHFAKMAGNILFPDSPPKKRHDSRYKKSSIRSFRNRKSSA